MSEKRTSVRWTEVFSLALLVGCLLSAGCGDDSVEKPTPKTNEQLMADFHELLDGAVAGDSAIRGAVMMVDAPLRDLTWKGAAGMAYPDSNFAMLSDDQFRTASIGKMTCAVLAMMFTWLEPS